MARPQGAKVFLFDEPTRGIDVGAKVEVFEVMDSLARAGAAILMVSSEMPELLQVPDRMLVMRQGRIDRRIAARHPRRKRSCDWRHWQESEPLRNDSAAAAVPHPDGAVRRRWPSLRRIS